MIWQQTAKVNLLEQSEAEEEEEAWDDKSDDEEEEDSIGDSVALSWPHGLWPEAGKSGESILFDRMKLNLIKFN